MACGESNVLVVDPGNRGEDDGTIVGQINVDAKIVTCPTFGGTDMKDLFITTASLESMVPGVQELDKNCGSIFKVRMDVPGVPRNKFGSIAVGAPKNPEYELVEASPYRLGQLKTNVVPRGRGELK